MNKLRLYGILDLVYIWLGTVSVCDVTGCVWLCTGLTRYGLTRYGLTVQFDSVRFDSAVRFDSVYVSVGDLTGCVWICIHLICDLRGCVWLCIRLWFYRMLLTLYSSTLYSSTLYGLTLYGLWFDSVRFGCIWLCTVWLCICLWFGRMRRLYPTSSTSCPSPCAHRKPSPRSSPTVAG